jgi:hypothetical protein
MERTVISSGQELTKWRLKEQCKESKNEKNLFFEKINKFDRL